MLYINNIGESMAEFKLGYTVIDNSGNCKRCNQVFGKYDKHQYCINVKPAGELKNKRIFK